MFDRTDMSCLGFKPSATIDEFPPRDSAPSVVRLEHCPPESSVAERTIEQRLNDRPLNLKWGLFLA